jgi:hypothetical protein
MLQGHKNQELADALIVGHPYATRFFEQKGWDARPVSNVEMRQLIESAPFMLAPAGLTTILEAAASRTPIGFLPEWNGSQAMEVDLLNATVADAYRAASLHSLSAMPRHAEADLLIEQLARGVLDGARGGLTVLREQFADVLSHTAGTNASNVASLQAEAIRRTFGGLEGAQQVSNLLINEVQFVPVCPLGMAR